MTSLVPIRARCMMCAWSSPCAYHSENEARTVACIHAARFHPESYADATGKDPLSALAETAKWAGPDLMARWLQDSRISA